MSIYNVKNVERDNIKLAMETMMDKYKTLMLQFGQYLVKINIDDEFGQYFESEIIKLNRKRNALEHGMKKLMKRL